MQDYKDKKNKGHKPKGSLSRTGSDIIKKF
jgi:hypothetical protein